ncbi:DUF4388 domain-containing protein [Thermogemmatispora tikiterensis]|uniref:DUF4388 domain-containing protein n=1 Tax=Thermogemmatispora tikiterensis TaxID=1825093 RepID=A0A328VFA6_9CHLR|nr:DUF4388 domain-containing protein [Thermogemmatispora tikiterensis]RAQ94732.1 hypothetical protein A4R35_04235 [Thermogemmatispora tikiterensis]
MSEQEGVTDHLVTVIQLIQLARGSGTLTAWRGTGDLFEQGVITFVKGQVTQASAGRRKDHAALNWLSTWGRCHYSFSPAVLDEATKQLLAWLAAGIMQPPRPATPASSQGPPSAAARGSLPGVSAGGHRQDARSSDASYYAVPYPVLPFQQALLLIEQYHLSRAHRQLFLLIDGRRRLLDLAQLMGKEPQVVSQLLSDLEQRGIIQRKGL